MVIKSGGGFGFSPILDTKVTDANAGQRLDLAAADLLECSRSLAASAVSTGHILVNGKKRRPSYTVKAGDYISGKLPCSTQLHYPEPISMPLDIVFEDRHIMVVNKEAGLVVHPGAGNLSRTLVNGLLAHDSSIAKVGDDPLRPGIVHRLDKDTSGLLAVAKTSQALTFLQKEFSCRRVRKWYLALVHGAGLADTGEIDLPIGRHHVHRKRMAVDHVKGKPAKTSWEVVRRFEDLCLVRIRLYTGRTHQIRVHFRALGHPLVGDSVYGFRKKKKLPSAFPVHQMLHAWKLAFSHPWSGRQMEYQAPLPPQWETLMENLQSLGN